MKLELQLDGPEPLTPGGVVSGAVRVLGDGRVRAVWLRLAFVERTKDYAEVVRVACEPRRLADGELSHGDLLPFSLTLPDDAPPSVAAPPYGSVGWELRAWADVRGRDPSAERALRVAPAGPA